MPVDERRRTAVAVLVRSVLDHLAAQEGQPHIGRMIDIQRWWRYGQEDFVGLRPQAWSMPAEVLSLAHSDGSPPVPFPCAQPGSRPGAGGAREIVAMSQSRRYVRTTSRPRRRPRRYGDPGAGDRSAHGWG